MPNLGYGGICVDDGQCDTDLACDSNPAGTNTFTCSLVEGDQCTSNTDCANNLQCKMGKCACGVRDYLIKEFVCFLQFY